MSAVFEGVLVPRTVAGTSGANLKKYCESQMGEIRIGLAVLDEEVSAIIRVGDRNAPFSDEFDELGSALSSTFGRALVVRYDSRIGHRSSSYCEGGNELCRFGEEDEVYSPLDDDGAITGVRVSFDELDEEEEYETIENAIELGLRRLGAGRWEDLLFLIYNQEALLVADC